MKALRLALVLGLALTLVLGATPAEAFDPGGLSQWLKVPASLAGGALAPTAAGLVVAGAGVGAFWGTSRLLEFFFDGPTRNWYLIEVYCYAAPTGTGYMGSFSTGWVGESPNGDKDLHLPETCMPTPDSPKFGGMKTVKLLTRYNGCGSYCIETLYHWQNVKGEYVDPSAERITTYDDCLMDALGCTIKLLKLVSGQWKECTATSCENWQTDPNTSAYRCMWGDHVMPLSDCATAENNGTASSPTVTETRIEAEVSCGEWAVLARSGASGAKVCQSPADATKAWTYSTAVPASQYQRVRLYAYCPTDSGSIAFVIGATDLPSSTFSLGCTSVGPKLLWTSPELQGAYTITVKPSTNTAHELDYHLRESGPVASGSTGVFSDPLDDVGPDGAGSGCYPRGWGLLNPIEWVEKPVKCALKWAFVPRADVVQGHVNTLNNAWSGTAPATAVGLVGDMYGAIAGYGDHQNVECSGPVVNLPSIGLSNFYPLYACDPPLSTVATMARSMGELALYVGAAFCCARIVMGAIGLRGGGD